MSKFGTLAIARVNEDESLTVLSTPFESKADAISAIEERLSNGEAGNTLQVIRLDSKYAAQQVTETRVQELVEDTEDDEDEAEEED